MAPRLLSWNQQVSLVQAGVIVLAMLFLICANAAALLFLQSYEAWQQSIDDRWGFLVQPEPNAEGAAVAAVWLGEFGTVRVSRQRPAHAAVIPRK
ncbi:hypothetical protein AK812_SmicGene18421 [Symbiodinium microadriaticum]|uniref:Uncharacterized protein n=1 Tax=Symbiodinium microadriaticum TaxID=2951 RepID=A0A1Q9DV49_SYMMI|nr:hypothetical protein AK812_SmicGene18421 [Symbiodinium microadriaticum]